MIKFSPFSRHRPDFVSEELVAVLSGKGSFEFKPLFDIIFAKLKARHCIAGGEDMLRLRTYEKLQGLVYEGKVTKTGKIYKGGTASILELGAKMKAFHDEVAELAAAAVALERPIP